MADNNQQSKRSEEFLKQVYREIDATKSLEEARELVNRKITEGYKQQSKINKLVEVSNKKLDNSFQSISKKYSKIEDSFKSIDKITKNYSLSKAFDSKKIQSSLDTLKDNIKTTLTGVELGQIDNKDAFDSIKNDYQNLVNDFPSSEDIGILNPTMDTTGISNSLSELKSIDLSGMIDADDFENSMNRIMQTAGTGLSAIEDKMGVLDRNTKRLVDQSTDKFSGIEQSVSSIAPDVNLDEFTEKVSTMKGKLSDIFSDVQLGNITTEDAFNALQTEYSSVIGQLPTLEQIGIENPDMDTTGIAKVYSELANFNVGENIDPTMGFDQNILNISRGFSNLTDDLSRRTGQLSSSMSDDIGELMTPFQNIQRYTSKFPLNLVFQNDKIDDAMASYKEKVGDILKQQKLGNITAKQGYTQIAKAGVGAFRSIATSITAMGATAAIATGGIFLAFQAIAFVFGKVKEAFTGIDEAASDFAKTTGILDDSLTATLINGTKGASILGGNVKLAGEYAASLVSEFSPALDLTSDMISNVAQIGERFGLGTDNAVKFTRIVSELTGATIKDAAASTEGIIDGLGRLGPAVTRNIVESYDAVIDSFGMGLDSLTKQAYQATKLGMSLAEVAGISEGLLDLQSSISAEFEASAILGANLNLMKARQLAYEGDIVGATNEVLDRVEALGGLENMRFYQRQAIAKATGLSISQLQKELNIRKNIDKSERISAATRESALGTLESAGRRIQNAFFTAFANPKIQASLNNLVKFIEDFFDNGKFLSVMNNMSNVIGTIAQVLTGEKGIISALWDGFTGGDGGNSNSIKIQDAVISPRGDIISTSPEDYLIATKNPTQLAMDVQMATPMLPTLMLGDIQLPTPNLGSIQVPTPNLGSIQVPTPNLGNIQLPTPNLGDVQVPTPNLGSIQVPTPMLGDIQLPTPNLGDVQVPTPIVPTPIVQKEVPPSTKSETVINNYNDKPENSILSEVRDLLRDLRVNGVKSNIYMDSRKVSTALAMGNRNV